MWVHKNGKDPFMPLTQHEPPESLPQGVREQRRAITSLIEELEAIAWYNERAAVSDDPELKSVLEHNRGEETEHAMMLLEWLRRNSAEFDAQMRTYLFTSAPLTKIEDAGDHDD